MRSDNSSLISNETAILQKLGFEGEEDNQRTLATIVNRMRANSSVLSYIMIIISYCQMISLGLCVSYYPYLKEHQYGNFLYDVLKVFCALPAISSSPYTFYLTELFVFGALALIWFLFFFIFSSTYKKKKTFSKIVVNVIMIEGYYIFNMLSVWIGNCAAYFVHSIISNDDNVSPIFAVVALIVYVSILFIASYMTEIYQSSPEVDVKDRFSYWPQNYRPKLYRIYFSYIAPFLIEIFNFDKNAQFFFIPIIICICMSCVGIFLIVRAETTVFPTGKVVLTTEYLVVIFGQICITIAKYTNFDELYLTIIFVVCVMIAGCSFQLYIQKKTKKKIDLLYSKFDNMVSHIDKPGDCITIIKLGIVYNAPCITNHTLLNWAINRWPNNQELLLLSSFIFYILKVPYRDILDLISVCVDIAPFTRYDGLLFFQIFNRLPTHEQELQRRLESIKRLYELPKISLVNFWESVLGCHYDEALKQVLSYHEKLENINRIFVNLIFENPSSDCVMEEYIKFTRDIMGNQIQASAALLEMQKRQANFETTIDPNVSESQSMNQLSRLSSMQSSVSISEFAGEVGGESRLEHGIQKAVNARPIFWGKRFLVLEILLSLCSLATSVIIFVLARTESSVLEDQVDLGLYLHEVVHSACKVLFVALEFPSHKDPITVTGEAFNRTKASGVLNNLTIDMEQQLVSSLTLHTSMPKSFLAQWTSNKVNTTLASPIQLKDVELTYMAALRIYQLAARTVAFTPDDALGDTQNLLGDIAAIIRLYNSISVAVNSMITSLYKIVKEEESDNNYSLYLALGICLGITCIVYIVCNPIIIINIKREYEFLISLYATVPPKAIHKILNQSDESISFDAFSDMRTGEAGNQVPESIVRTYNYVLLLLGAFVLIPMPIALIVYSFIQHQNDSMFIFQAVDLSSTMLSSLGNLYLDSYSIISDIPLGTEEEHKENLKEKTETILEMYNELYFGHTDKLGRGFVYQEQYASFVLKERCEALIPRYGYNKSCILLHTSIYYLYFHCKRLLNAAASPSGFDSEWWKYFFDIGDYVLNNLAGEFANLGAQIAANQKQNNTSFMISAVCVSIALFLIINFLSFEFVFMYVDPSMRAILDPILVMKFDSIAESNTMVRFLQGDFDAPKRVTSDSLHRKGVIGDAYMNDFVSEGIIALTADGVIVGTNKPYHKMMGTNMDGDIIGSNITTVLPAEAQPIFDELENIKSGGTAKPQETIQLTLFTYEDREVQTKVKLVTTLQKEEHGNKSTLCAIIIYDLSSMQSINSKLAKEKEHVSAILNSLLPQSIAVSLINEEDNFNFDAPNATILVASIPEFSALTKDTPYKQVVQILNSIFREFDDELTVFPRITKIRCYGNVYVAAGGLFEGDGTAKASASDIVRFGMKLVEAAHRIAAVSNLRIVARIGVHSGGPVTCGVINRDRPTFDIISPVLNLAKEMEANGHTDQVHISADTADLLAGSSISLSSQKTGKVPNYPKQTYYVKSV